MTLALWILLLIPVALIVALVLAARRSLRTEVWIDATPERVWSVLADTARYPEWNPFIVHVEGALIEGARLTNTLRQPDGKTMVFRPRLLRVAPGQELRWIGRLGMPRLFDGEHFFLLSPEGDGTRLDHGEDFTGVLLWFVDVRSFAPAFEALNQQLKVRVEASVD